MKVTHKPHILVVDEDGTMRSGLRFIMEFLGVSVSLAENGEEALEKMDKGSFDLVLLEINMPGLGGQEVLARMQIIHPRIQVLMMSTREECPPEELAIRGASGFLRKPFRISDLLQAVKDTQRSDNAE